MKENITGIVLGTVKHSDRHNVTSIYTRERGRIAVLAPAGTSKKSKLTSSRLLPMSVIEAQANIMPTREINTLSAILPVKVWRTLYYEPIKSTIILFLTEFLTKLLRDAQPEPLLWDFIANSISVLDATANRMEAANFHITFLVSMSYMMGIQPNLDGYQEGMEFDMKSGNMVYPFNVMTSKGIRIDAARSAFLPILSRINYANSRYFRFSGKERTELLENILKYYGLHFPGCDNLKSLDVLKELYT